MIQKKADILVRELLKFNKMGKVQPSNQFNNERSSYRLKNFNYAGNAQFFITICVHKKECRLGTVSDGHIHLNTIGEIAEKYWRNIPNIFPYVVLHEYIIMPNHIHGIIEIQKKEEELNEELTRKNQFGKTIPTSISAVINQYKSAVKRWCNKNGFPEFKWQNRFHDHVIRSWYDYARISEYIQNNPLRWKE